MVPECIRAYFQKIKCRRSLKRHPWNRIHVFKLLRILGRQKEIGAQRPVITKMMNMFCFICMRYSVHNFFSKSMTQRAKPKCAATDYESLVVAITLQYVACIIYVHNTDKGSQKFLSWLFSEWIQFMKYDFPQ